MRRSWIRAVSPALLALAATVAVAPPSFAGLTVSYSTSGLFSGSGTSSETITLINNTFGLNHESVTISYAGASNTLNNVPLTNGPISSLGTFTATDNGNGTGSGNVTPTTFTMTVTQTQPSSGSAQETANVTGTYSYFLSAGQTFLDITFANPQFTIGGISYTLGTMNGNTFTPLASNGNGFDLNTPFFGNTGTVVLDAQIVAPEPSTIASAASGVVVLAGAWWRRRRRRIAA